MSGKLHLEKVLSCSRPCLFSVLYFKFVVINLGKLFLWGFLQNKKESENSLKYGAAPLIESGKNNSINKGLIFPPRSICLVYIFQFADS